MRRVEIIPEGVPPKDDPQVETAMKVWDYLNEEERAEVFRTVYRFILAQRRTEDIDHLARLADSVYHMVEDESTTDVRDRIRAAANRKPVPADDAAVEELLRRLEG